MAQSTLVITISPSPCAGMNKTAIGADRSFRTHDGAHRWALQRNPSICLSGTPVSAPIPPSACIPVPALWSDLIVARVYACVVGQGGRMDGQETETQ